MPQVQEVRGFTLLELGVVLVLIGIVLGIGVPTVLYSTSATRLRAGADGLAMHINLARARAVDSQSELILRFAQDSLNADFHVRDSQGGVSGLWKLPPRVQYAPGSASGVTFLRDGRASAPCYVLLMDQHAHVDTVSIQVSGLVLGP